MVTGSGLGVEQGVLTGAVSASQRCGEWGAQGPQGWGLKLRAAMGQETKCQAYCLSVSQP